MTSQVTVIGDALIDELRHLSGDQEHVGGAALNVAVGLTRLGVSATLIAMVGEDEPGERIRSYLDGFGIRLIATPSPSGTARAISTRNGDGEPRYEFTEAARLRRIRFGRQERIAISDADAVVVSGYPFDDPAQAGRLRTALASASGIVAVDPNPREGLLRDRGEFIRGFEALAAHTDLVKVGDDDAALLYGASIDDLRLRLLSIGSQIVLATHGPGGGSIHSRDMSVSRPVPALPAPIIDTMGAGDAVLASAVASLLDRERREQNWEMLLERAMDIAAATCRHTGALLRTA